MQAQLSVAISKADGSGMGVVDAADTAFVQLQLEPQWPGHANSSQLKSPPSTARQGQGYWMEIYGSEGTLVLGSSNQSDYVHGFSCREPRGRGAGATASRSSELCPQLGRWPHCTGSQSSAGGLMPFASSDRWFLGSSRGSPASK